MTVNHTHIRRMAEAHGAAEAYAELLARLNKPPTRAVLHRWKAPFLKQAEWVPPLTMLDTARPGMLAERLGADPLRMISLRYIHYEISHKAGWAFLPPRWEPSSPFCKLQERYVSEHHAAMQRASLAQRQKGRRGAVATTKRLIVWLKDATTHNGRHGTIFVDQVLDVIDGIATGANEHGADWCPTGTHAISPREDGRTWRGYFAATLGKDDDRTTIYAVIEFHDSRYRDPSWARRENMHARKRHNIRTDGGAIILTGARVSTRAKRMARRGPGTITGSRWLARE